MLFGGRQVLDHSFSSIHCIVPVFAVFFSKQVVVECNVLNSNWFFEGNNFLQVIDRAD